MFKGTLHVLPWSLLKHGTGRNGMERRFKVLKHGTMTRDEILKHGALKKEIIVTKTRNTYSDVKSSQFY